MMLRMRGGMLEHFNPRSHEGSDPRALRLHGDTKDFNPRSHEGSDDCAWSDKSRCRISILAPTRGATEAQETCVKYGEISILAPTRGATLLFVLLAFFVLFQSSLPRGERRKPQ